jgi:hypothetical protein
MVKDGGVERTEVLESWPLPDGRVAFRVEYRRADTAVDAVLTSDQRGNLVQLSQSGGLATFDPPLIVLGPLRIGAHWSTSAAMVFPSKFRASSPTEVAGRVVGFETVTVPAGTFRAFRVEQVTNGRACTAWHAPGIGMIRESAYDEELILQRIVDP